MCSQLLPRQKRLICTLKTNPPLCLCFSQSAHLAMIDTLMMAYTVETVSAEKVMACIRQYSPGNTEVEMPYDTEDAVTTWINKVSACTWKCVLTSPHCIISSLKFSVCLSVTSQHSLSCDESRKWPLWAALNNHRNRQRRSHCKQSPW